MSKKQIHAVVAVPRLSGEVYASYSLCGQYVWNNGSRVTNDKNEVTCLRCLNSNKWHSFLHFNDHVIGREDTDERLKEIRNS